MMLALLLLVSAPQEAALTQAYENAHWYDGDAFVHGTFYVVDGVLRADPPGRVDQTFDLDGQYVVPPYGEAHNHWLEPDFTREYVAHHPYRGVFYVKDQGTSPWTRKQVAPHVNRPDSVDYIAANQGFTGPGGHPLQIAATMQALGALPAEWGPAEMDGNVVFVIDDQADLEASWERFLKQEPDLAPDFVKVFLLYSELHDERSKDDVYLHRRGLDPAFVPWIVEQAHATGLEVSAHVYSAADFRTALEAGVDQIAHFPGIGYESELPQESFRITAADADLAAERGVSVVTTLSDATSGSGPDSAYVREVLAPNFQLLWERGVSIVVGTDVPRATTDTEVRQLLHLELLSPAELLKVWCEDTPRAIFPERKLGRLKDGYEASFLVLAGDPLEDFANTQRISLRVKQGRMLFPRDPVFPAQLGSRR